MEDMMMDSYDRAGLELSDLREEITRLDEAMAELFVMRMQISARIAEVKREEGLPIFDPAREEENLRQGESRVEEELRPYYNIFLQQCMDLSKAWQEKHMGREK